MQFPPEWSFADVANLEAYQYSRMEDRKPGMEIIVHFVDGKAGDFRIVLGGSQHRLHEVRRVEDFRTPLRR